MDTLRSNQISSEQKLILQSFAESVAKKGVRFLEIGSWLGDSAVILGKVAQKHHGSLICVDWWKGNPGTELDGIASKNDIFSIFWKRICDEGLEEVIIPIRAHSQKALKYLKSNSYQLIFIDGDHRYQHALRDIENCAGLVSLKGGILCGHDCEGYISDFDSDFLEEGKDIDFHQTVHCGVVLAVGAMFKKYSIDYSVWSVTHNGKKGSWKPTQLDFQSLNKRRQATPPPLGVSNNYKLYRYGKHIYASPHSLANFDPSENQTQTPPEVLVGKNIEEVVGKLKEDVHFGPPPSLQETYKSYNLVNFKNNIYAIHQSLGPLDLMQLDEPTLKKYKNNGLFFLEDTNSGAKDQIDRIITQLVKTNHKGFNIVRHSGRYYAVSQELGPIPDWDNFDFEQARKSFKCFIGESIDEVQDAIDQRNIQKPIIDVLFSLQKEITQNFQHYPDPKNEVLSLKEMIKQMNCELITKNKDIQNMERLAEKKEENIKSLEKQVEQRTNDIKSLEQSAEKKNEDICTLEAETKTKTKNIADLEQLIRKKEEDIKSLENSAKEKSADILSLKSEIEALKNQVEQKTSDVKSLEQSVEKKSADIHSLKSEIEAKTTTIEDMEQLVERKGEDARSLEKLVENKNTNLHSLEAEIKTKTRSIEDLGSELKEIKTTRWYSLMTWLDKRESKFSKNNSPLRLMPEKAPMKILYNNLIDKPLVSFVLLDWSCRESFHFLHYINKQTVPRNQYEVIWIEYYQRRAKGIDETIDTYEKSNKPPCLDQWISMNMPSTLYYHKHLMYNVGIVRAHGEIVVICDSDAMVTPKFVETIVQAFQEDPNIILHMDEVRNNSKDYYPFNFPTFKQVEGKGAINFKNGTTTGILDKVDPLHTRNYGACMAARRDDIIAIGGADEHIDYLGHVCGPYDITFRLKNLNKREIWHPTELLYHVWHPGQAGDDNYMGPHDGMHMSTQALQTLKNGRTLSLKENQAIRSLRLKENRSEKELQALLVGEDSYHLWSEKEVAKLKNFYVCQTTHLLESLKGFNIVKRDKTYYGLPQYLGAIDLNNEEDRNHPKVLTGNSIKKVKNKIKKTLSASKNIDVNGDGTLLSSYNSYNMIQFNGSVYGCPQSLGSLDLRLEKSRKHPAILNADTKKELKKKIKEATRSNFCAFHYPLLRKLIGHTLYTFLSRIKRAFQ